MMLKTVDGIKVKSIDHHGPSQVAIPSQAGEEAVLLS
jgi:hypothetical protein